MQRTITLEKQYVDILQIWGKVDELVGMAVKRFLIDRIDDRIRLARQKVSIYEKTYDMDYASFSRKVQLDEEYYQEVNCKNPLWEQDLLGWEYWHKEAQEWTEKLNAILSKF